MSLSDKFEIKIYKNRLNISLTNKDFLKENGFLPSSKVKLTQEEKKELQEIRDCMEENSNHKLGAIYLKALA